MTGGLVVPFVFFFPILRLLAAEMFFEMLALYGVAALSGWAMSKVFGPAIEDDIYYHRTGEIKLDCERYIG
jgi:hypothetical protein